MSGGQIMIVLIVMIACVAGVLKARFNGGQSSRREAGSPPAVESPNAARLRDAGRPFKEQAAIAKLTASDAAMDNARDATQIFGGNGFMNEYAVARHYRDSKILEIGEGTTEVQLLVIARALGVA